MRTLTTLHPPRRAAVSTLALILAAVATPTLAQSIDFKAEIPQAPAEMKVFKLAPSKPPVALVNEALRTAKLSPLAQENKALVAHDARVKDDPQLVRAYISDTGDTYLTPSTADLVALPVRTVNADAALGVARKAFADEAFIPHDTTELKLGALIPVMGGAGAPPAKLTATKPALTVAAKARQAPGGSIARVEPKTVMVMVPAVRYAAGLPVYGRGSHAVITIAADGTLAGALRRWRTADAGESVKTEINADQVHADILRQLKGKVPEGSSAVVDKIELAYYDRNADFLQPVYRFEAVIKPRDEKTSPIRIAGFVPVVKPREAIPDLAGPPAGEGPKGATEKLQPQAALTPAEDARLRAKIGGAGTADDFTLGEYANQDWPNDSGYVDMSYAFLNGLQDSTSAVNRTQWYEAHNWEVVGPNSRYYMNAVNVAYTVPHGNWLYNTTLRNNAEGWNVPNIGTGGNPGFGHAAGGVLATWVIMSCEVIPSYYDRLHKQGGTGSGYTAFDAWWGVFQGLHNVIGFRTIMFYPDDDLNYDFGQDAAHGGDINTAWFQEVAADDGDDGTYASQYLTGAPQVHYDRASTMIDGRDLGHSIFHISAQSASTTLWSFWMGN